MAEAFHPDAGYVVNELQDGRTLAVSRRSMPDGGSVAVHQDITAHLHAEKELNETKQFLNSIIENIPIAVVVKDVTTRKVILVNRTFEAMLKVSRIDVLGKTVFEIYRTKDAERIDAADNKALAEEFGAHSSDYEVEMPGGDTRIFATNRIVVRDSEGGAKHLVVVIDDIIERKKSEQRIAFMAHYDVLTGSPNRLSIMEKIDDAVARHRRRGDSFAVLLCSTGLNTSMTRSGIPSAMRCCGKLRRGSRCRSVKPMCWLGWEATNSPSFRTERIISMPPRVRLQTASSKLCRGHST